jgi:hypothetical protein
MVLRCDAPQNRLGRKKRAFHNLLMHVSRPYVFKTVASCTETIAARSGRGQIREQQRKDKVNAIRDRTFDVQ